MKNNDVTINTLRENMKMKEEFKPKVRTVYNNDNKNHKTGKYSIFMGEPLGLHDTINVTYKDLDDIYKLQRSCMWTENEANLEESRLDMLPPGQGGKTRPEEIDILTKAVSYLWEADSIASRSVFSIFSPFLSNSEATTLLIEHTRFESIHALTYSEIVRQCITDPNKIFDEIAKNEAILNRTDLIIETFDELVEYGAYYLLGRDDIPRTVYRQSILKGLMALILLERVQFMSSFAVVFGLSEQDRFVGIAKLVGLICRDELIHAEIVATILKRLREDKEWDDDFKKLIPTFLKMTKEIVEREFQWNNYLFSEGRSMVGLNAELLDEWVLYNTEEMCRMADIPYEYESIKENPIEWFYNHLRFDEIQNANQESDNTNYRLNPLDDDLGSDVLEFDFDM